jgi:hypothetical protein
MKWLLAVLMTLHGLIHLLGFAKGFGFADLPQLAQPVTRAQAIGWFVSAVSMLVAAGMSVAAPRLWWVTGLGAVTAWSDARLGTVVNLVILAAAVYGFASEGPLSLRAEYRREVDSMLERSEPRARLTEADISHLPEPVRNYVRSSGAVGKPRPDHIVIGFRGRIRAAAEEPWMSFVAEQHSFLHEPARLFLMRAKRGGLPVDVLHSFRGGAASMRVRLLSVVPLADASGADATQAETVTLLNDLCLFAPGALADDAIRWTPIDAHTARADYTLGPNTVSAVLHFNRDGELVDFVSDDRLMASADGTRFERARWSTPVSDYSSFDDRRAASRGEARWHPPQGAFAYIELQVIELHVDAANRSPA